MTFLLLFLQKEILLSLCASVQVGLLVDVSVHCVLPLHGLSDTLGSGKPKHVYADGIRLQPPLKEQVIQLVLDLVIFIFQHKCIEVDQFSQQYVLVSGKSFPLVLVVHLDSQV